MVVIMVVAVVVVVSLASGNSNSSPLKQAHLHIEPPGSPNVSFSLLRFNFWTSWYGDKLCPTMAFEKPIQRSHNKTRISAS